MDNEARKTIQKQTEKCNKEIKIIEKKLSMNSWAEKHNDCKNFNRKNLQEDLTEQRNLWTIDLIHCLQVLEGHLIPCWFI